MDFPGDSDDKETCLQCEGPEFHPWVEKIPWGRECQLTILAWRIPWTEELDGLI